MAILLTLDMDADLALFAALKLFLLPLAGSVLVGLPSALLLLRKLDRPSLPSLLLWANILGALLVLVAFVWGQGFGAFFVGLPCVLAANAFALFGWLIIVPTARETTSD